MPSARTIESLTAEMAVFLDAALDGIVPEREIAAASALGKRLLEHWPEDDDAWRAAREEIAKGVAVHLVSRPEVWARALHIITIYLDHAQLDEPHPRQEEATGTRHGKPVYGAKFGFGQPVAEALLEQAAPEERRTLFETLDEWEAWTATAKALAAARLSLDTDEVIELMTCILRFVETDGARSLVLDSALEGLGGSLEAVDAIVEGWLVGERRHASIDIELVRLLAIWRLPSHPEARELRERLVQQMTRLPVERGAYAAMTIAFQSWSPDALIDDRRGLLLETLDRLGDPGGSAALRALAFDPNTKDFNALEILDAIVDKIQEHDARTTVDRLNVLWWITSSIRDGEHARRLIDRLPAPAILASGSPPVLDHLLETLALHTPEAVQSYVLDWIEHHTDQVARGGGLDRALPLTRRRLEGSNWLLEAMVSARRERRRGAILCLIGSRGRDGKGVPSSSIDFGSLLPDQVEGLAHELLGLAPIGDVVIEWLFALARARLDCLDRIGALLEIPAMQAYPGRHRRCVEEWASKLSDRPEDDPEQATVRALQDAIERDERMSEVLSDLSTVLFAPTRPTAEPMRQWLNRIMRIGEERTPALWKVIATEIPIACGAEWSDARSPNQSTPFKEHSITMEGLALESYDRVAARVNRLMHARHAQRLLGGDEDQQGQA